MRARATASTPSADGGDAAKAAKKGALSRARARLRRRDQGREITQAMRRRAPVPGVTYAIMALCGLMWLLTAFASDAIRALMELGALYGPYVMEGQWLRIPMSMFLHAGFGHLIGNMVVLGLAGSTAERLFGQLTFSVLYLACGLVGAVASLVFHPGLLFVGASAAVLGTLAAVVGFLLRRPEARRSVRLLGALWTAGIALLIYNVFTASLQIFGAFMNVGLAAHAGGIVLGFVLGFLIARPATEKTEAPRQWAALAVAIVGVALVAGGMHLVRRVDDAVPLILDVRDLEANIRETSRTAPWTTMDGAGRLYQVGSVGEYGALGYVRRREVLPRYREFLARANAMHNLDPALEEPMAELTEYLRARVEQMEVHKPD